MCTLEKRGRVYLLTLTGASDHRLHPTLIGSLRAALARVRAEAPRGSVLVTAAEGRFFSNGFDFSLAASSPAAARALLSESVSLFAPLVADLVSLPLPTIAAVTGHAAAAGFLLALSHDYALMRSDRGVLYMSEIDIGLPFPNYFMEVMRSKIVDPRVLRDITMRAKKISAKEAVERGVIDAAYGTAEETLAAAVKLGEELAGRNWDGEVYASIRMGAFPMICRAVGLAEEKPEAKAKVFASKL